MPGREEMLREVNKDQEDKLTFEQVRLWEEKIVACVLERKRVSLPGFGIFEMKDIPARRCRNPQTGEPMMSEPKSKLVFRPSAVTANLHKMEGFTKPPKKK